MAAKTVVAHEFANWEQKGLAHFSQNLERKAQGSGPEARVCGLHHD
jgi:hypothetical protein